MTNNPGKYTQHVKIWLCARAPHQRKITDYVYQAYRGIQSKRPTPTSAPALGLFASKLPGMMVNCNITRIMCRTLPLFDDKLLDGDQFGSSAQFGGIRLRQIRKLGSFSLRAHSVYIISVSFCVRYSYSITITMLTRPACCEICLSYRITEP